MITRNAIKDSKGTLIPKYVLFYYFNISDILYMPIVAPPGGPF